MGNIDEVILAFDIDETQGSTTVWAIIVPQDQLILQPPKYDFLDDGPRVTGFYGIYMHILHLVGERIGCHGVGERTGCTLCSTCQFEPDDSSCRYVMKNSRMAPLYKGMCGY